MLATTIIYLVIGAAFFTYFMYRGRKSPENSFVFPIPLLAVCCICWPGCVVVMLFVMFWNFLKMCFAFERGD